MRFSLLGIAHLVMGKCFQVLEVHQEMKHIWDVSGEKRPDYGFTVFCKILGKKPSFYICSEKEL